MFLLGEIPHDVGPTLIDFTHDIEQEKIYIIIQSLVIKEHFCQIAQILAVHLLLAAIHLQQKQKHKVGRACEWNRANHSNRRRGKPRSTEPNWEQQQQEKWSTAGVPDIHCNRNNTSKKPHHWWVALPQGYNSMKTVVGKLSSLEWMLCNWGCQWYADSYSIALNHYFDNTKTDPAVDGFQICSTRANGVLDQLWDNPATGRPQSLAFCVQCSSIAHSILPIHLSLTRRGSQTNFHS